VTSRPEIGSGFVVLVHHAEALGPDVDPHRALSARGLAQASWLANWAKAAGIFPTAVWHSGKQRSRQTAEMFLVTCNPRADFRMVRGLRPDDPAGWMHDALVDTSDVVVVGHMPHLPALLSLLAPGTDTFPLHGLVVLERAISGGYEERRRVQPPAVLQE
jgi:phosphohistidine phosphatase